MTRLIHELRKGGILLPEGVKTIIGDAVWTEIDKSADRQWKSTDFPNIAPPFDHYFVEATSELAPGYYCGLLFSEASKAKFKTPRTAQTFQSLRPAGTHWQLVVRAYSFMNGFLFAFPGFFLLHVDEQGRWLDDSQNVSSFIDNGFADKPKEYYWSQSGITLADAMNCIPFALTTISLLHCKNISVEEDQLPRPQRRLIERKSGAPADKFYTLKIRGKPQAGDRGAADRPAVGLNREHIARGHFKTFSTEHKLFGKWEGTYWWESMVRGNPERGKLDKHYKVEPQQENKYESNH